MLLQSLIIGAALLGATRFGPNDDVRVEKVGDQTRLTAYGSAQIVTITADDFEISDCKEVFNDGLNPGRCFFVGGERILVERNPNGSKITFQGLDKTNTVEFVVTPAQRKAAAKALSP